MSSNLQGQIGNTSEQQNLSVTTVIRRKVKPGKEAEYEAWAREIASKALAFDGHQGVNLIPPAGKDDRYTLIFRFDSHEHLQAWEDSQTRKDLAKVGSELSEPETTEVKRYDSLEFWFDLEQKQKAPGRPAKYKMVTLTVLGLYPMIRFFIPLLPKIPVINLIYLLPDWLATVPALFITTGILTYLVMPLITKVFKFWLYPGS
jgi:antibiotic biosynthesis monooxygenase (ABM) superfamily enzyme